MKWIFVTFAFLSIDLIYGKVAEKKYGTKKAFSIKPTKNPKVILDYFKDLPPDDRDFLKQVEKQFEFLGNNLKIKIERDNSTSNKNSKRTIDGNLGYGYQNNQPSQNYYFSKPKFQHYPYSQHDIPPSSYSNQKQSDHTYQSSQYNNKQYLPPPKTYTTVEIAQSEGYELKEEPYQEYNHASQQPYQHHVKYVSQEQVTPVIVLRIPGPIKYALHLQALLQQYLEIRAAQYIKILQDQENAAANKQNNHQYHNNNYIYTSEYQGYQEQEQHPQSYEVHPDQLYQQDSGENADQSQYNDQHNYEQVQQVQQVQEVQPVPQVQQVQHVQQEHVNIEPRYEYTSDYNQPRQQYGYVYSRPTAVTDLPSSENYPRSSHTQVYFPSSLRPHGYVAAQPSIPDTYQHQSFHPPLVYNSQSSQEEYEYTDQEYGPSSERSSVHDVQTTPPFNYHAHSTKAPSMKGAKRQTSLTEEQYEKFSKFVTRLKEKSAASRANKKASE